MIFGSFAFELIAIRAHNLTGGTTRPIIVPAVGVLIVVVLEKLIPNILIPGIGEEMGWRGFALPRLQAKYGALIASLILGIIWALWHFPGYWMGAGIHNTPPLLFVLFVVPFTIWITWVYNHTRGSVLISVLFHASFHASFNATLDLLPFRPLEEVVPVSTALLGQTGLTDPLFGAYRMTVVALWLSDRTYRPDQGSTWLL